MGEFGRDASGISILSGLAYLIVQGFILLPMTTVVNLRLLLLKSGVLRDTLLNLKNYSMH